jgi:high-affinity K+ transport system ATPase subunit B
MVDGHAVAVGSAEWALDGAPVPAEVRRVRRRTSLEGAATAFLSVDGRLKAALVLADPIRPESPRTIRALKRIGIEKIILLTGDHPDVAEIVGAAVGVRVLASGRRRESRYRARQGATPPRSWSATGVNGLASRAARGRGHGRTGATASCGPPTWC